MKDSLKILYDEHNIIMRAIDQARKAKELIGRDNEKYEFTISELIRFFRLYADQYHHHKEEIILFPEMSRKSELMTEGILKEMLDNHEDFREMLRSIESSLHSKEYTAVAEKLEKYATALLDHISVENDELFQAAYSIFNEDELENIYYRFIDLDHNLGEMKKENLTTLLNELK